MAYGDFSIPDAQWWEGVELWYNHQLYGHAVDLWSTDARSLDDFNNVASLLSILQSFHPSDHHHDTVTAERLVFLASCHLDARSFTQTRFLCLHAIAMLYDKKQRHCNSNSVTVRAVQTLIASFEEDGDSSAGRLIVDWVIDKKFCDYWIDAYQRPGYIHKFNGETNDPVIDRAHYPSWISILEANFDIIRQEYEQLQHWHSVGSGLHRDGAGSHDGSVVSRGEWDEFVLFGSGYNHDLVQRYTPKTWQLLKQLDNVTDCAEQGAGEIIFSRLQPHTQLAPHCAGTNIRLTAHLGIKVPESTSQECSIRVRDIDLHWQEGKVLVFDDSYEHAVTNNTDETRVVLLIRFWRSNVNKGINEALQYKRDDELWRYNPPCNNNTVTQRGLTRECCPHCGDTGYESIRVVAECRFACACGAEMI